MPVPLHKIIADQIINRFRSGLELDDDTRHFFISCEGLAGTSEINDFLNDRSCDSSPVYELIFYPDTGMRLLIEPLIPARGLDREEILRIGEAVDSGGHDILVNTGNMKVILPRDRFRTSIARYIQKLNLDVNADIFPDENTDEFLQERVLLRRLRYTSSGENIEFLKILIERAGSRETADFAGLFSFALEITCGKNEKTLDLLENRKFYYESAIRESAEFSTIIGKYSMEFIMAKKIPVPLTGMDEAFGAIRKIDALTSLVYGIIIPSMDHGVEMLLKDGGLTEIY